MNLFFNKWNGPSTCIPNTSRFKPASKKNTIAKNPFIPIVLLGSLLIMGQTSFAAVGSSQIMSSGITAKTLQTVRSEEHTSEIQSLILSSYAVLFLQKKRNAYCISE